MRHGRRLILLGGFALVDSDDVEVPLSRSHQRLLAFLAIAGQPQRRERVAWTLWDQHTEAQALACLRTALWRLPRPDASGLIDVTPTCLGLAADIEVDWRMSSQRARGAIAGEDIDTRLIDGLRQNLLPDWYEHWLDAERECFHQLRLSALETMSQRLVAAGQLFDSLDAALVAVAADPFRETAHRCVIESHLAAGNQQAALSQYSRYSRELRAAGMPTVAPRLLAPGLPTHQPT